jgi:hypothetical protein
MKVHVDVNVNMNVNMSVNVKVKMNRNKDANMSRNTKLTCPEYMNICIINVLHEHENEYENEHLQSV